MTDIAIHVENLGKAYQIAHEQRVHSYRTLQEEMIGLLLRSFGRGASGQKETFWALRDVSFEVRRGQVLGIIGRNGAGKSTLLKILSRITRPTTGYADVYGRVGSLLEVGTGFQPELTGRENVYLNGAILGMTRRDIRRKFDEIIAFAEVERFLDTPVKRYSSGMYMRLAFAVAAHLEPEILLVDEVLAVGDYKFQEKCMGKMSDVASEGRTVLFVSHSMPAVQRLCGSGVVLERGQIIYSGTIDQAIATYTENSTRVIQGMPLKDRTDRKGSGPLRFTQVSIHDAQDDRELDRVLSGEDIVLRFHYESPVAYDNASVNIAFNVYNAQGVLITNLNTRDAGKMLMPVGNAGYFECAWPKFNLRTGVYTCTLYGEINGTIMDWIQAAFQIHAEDGDFFGTGSLISRSQGDVLVDYDWRSEPELSPHPLAPSPQAGRGNAPREGHRSVE